MYNVPEYAGSAARSIEWAADDIDTQIARERELKALRESRPSIYSAHVSRQARDEWQKYLWLNQERVRHYRVRDQEHFTGTRPGRNIHIQLFLKKLNTLSRRRFQLNTWALRGMRGLSVSMGGAPMKYLGAVQDGMIPEWDKISLDEHGLVKRVVRRGWRTTLMMLCDAGAITEKEIQQLFGWAWGAPGHVWRRSMWESRNRRLWDGEQNREYWRLQERVGF